MKRGLLFAIILVVIILIITTGYKKQYEANSVEGAESKLVIEKQYVNITYDADISDFAIQEIQRGIASMPADVIRGFTEQDWKVSVVKDIKRDEDIFPMSAVGETDFNTNTVSVQAEPLPAGVANVYLIRTVHEMSHFADHFYGNLADQDEWTGIYEDNKDKYVEYEYSGIDFIDDFAEAAKYATSDRYEMFACGMKDFILHPDYLKRNYPDLYRYFKKVLQ